MKNAKIRKVLLRQFRCPLRAFFGFVVLVAFACVFVPEVRAQASGEFDFYRIRLDGFWIYSNPSGAVQSSLKEGAIDLQKDLGFNTYSTGAGKLDWRFTRKNHLYVLGVAFNSAEQVVLTRAIAFKGQTFDAGLAVNSSLHSPMYGLGYQYDLIRRRRGHLGLGVQFNLFDAHASIRAPAQVTGGSVQHAVSASPSLLAPIRVAGPEFRLYLTHSPRVFVEANAYGMYFFGYGDFVSAMGDLGFTVNNPRVCMPVSNWEAASLSRTMPAPIESAWT